MGAPGVNLALPLIVVSTDGFRVKTTFPELTSVFVKSLMTPVMVVVCQKAVQASHKHAIIRISRLRMFSFPVFS